jgi:ABC-type multidrug transport system fused ATPase/permease subunit
MWINYNNIIRSLNYIAFDIITMEIIPYNYNQPYSIFDYIMLNIFLIFVIHYKIKSSNAIYLQEQNQYKLYKNKIDDLTKDIINNINIINENNTYNIESDKNLNLIFNLIHDAYSNNINIYDYINKHFNDFEFFVEILGKYLLFSFSKFNPAISFQIEKFYYDSALLDRRLDKNYTYSIDNRVYEEILDYKCKDENNENLFIEDCDILYKIEGLNHSFDTNKIFEDVNIIIQKNKWICFYGNSGCGKSTLCNILLRKLNPSNGIIKYMGEYSDYEYTNLRDSVSFVNTDPDIFNNTILYNVTYGLKELENEIVMEKVMGKINYYLELFDLSMYKNNLDKHIDSLSTGQIQRIKIIRLILHDKDIWILDEITSNIDNELEKVILQELKGIQKEKNKSVIHITHNLENISFSDKKMYIRNYNIYNA